MAAGPPNGFVLTESQGDCLVTLTKENGNETITVELVAGSEVGRLMKSGAWDSACMHAFSSAIRGIKTPASLPPLTT